MDSTALREMQAPLKDKYRSDPDAAVVTLRARGDLAGVPGRLLGRLQERVRSGLGGGAGARRELGRELAADRSGAILIGQPQLLANALIKVSGEMARIPTRDLRSAEHFNAFFFTPALAQGTSLSSLFSTHPPLQKRLDQLAKLTAGTPGMRARL